MAKSNVRLKFITIVSLVLAITFLHYITQKNEYYYHIFYRELYYLPIILAGFWFGLRGSLATSVATCLLYAPVVIMNWNGFSVSDFDKIIEIILFNVIAVIVGTLVDRERKNQIRLRKAERLASVGKALSGVAHDIRTPLIAIGGFSRLVQKNFKKCDPNYRRLDIVIREISRLEKMVRDMLDFSGALRLRKSIGNIAMVLEESMVIVESEARKKGVKVVLKNGGVSPISFDYAEIKRVFINLLMNSVQASREHSTVSIQLREEKEEILIDIADCGCGLPMAEDQVFIPFYSTRKRGTGLGLSIAKKIIEAHNGDIAIVRNTPEGATFRVKLPKSEGLRG
ncbi:MAG TPA: PAS domain-containing sensor histidine kinase [Deltaproteobacteria bacterium]|nr:PAS domain-containing sensor histidine kinase [Deltaproteobacteria bacterium]HEC31890.1 PAS domain-containing sensor histidine kinase [Deltaproteobacteria bacterium]